MALALLIPITTSAEETTRTITVQGEGRISQAPNIATISAGVVSQALTPKYALAANNKAVTKVFEALTLAGVTVDDKRTRGFNVTPVYSRTEPGGQPLEVTGYRARSTITVGIWGFDNLGKFLDTIIAAGADQIFGLSFSLREPGVTVKWAMRKAVMDAQRRARIYARKLGVEVGQPISISETETTISRPRMVAAAAEVREGVLIAPGEIEIVSRVRVVYAIED